MKSSDRRNRCFPLVMVAVLAILLLAGALIESKILRGVSWSHYKCETVVLNSSVSKSVQDKESSVSQSAVQFQMVVALLYDIGQNWAPGKSQNTGDTGSFLLDDSVKDIPVEIMSMDCLYDPKKSNSTFQPETVYSGLKNRTGTIEFVPLLNGKAAQECPAYLTYILRNYHNLPDVSIFLHAKPKVHNPHILQDIRYIVDHWKPEEIGFLHLNRYPVCRATNHTRWQAGWGLLGFKQEHMPPFVQSECCAQFMVTRERILLRPRWFWEQLLKHTYETQNCAFQEHFWHIFFGEQAFLAEERKINYYRKRSPNGNLNGQWKPPQKAVLTHPYPNVPFSDTMAVWHKEYVSDPKYYKSLTGSQCQNVDL